MSAWMSFRSWIGSALFFIVYIVMTAFTGFFGPLVAYVLPVKWRQPVLNTHNKVLLFLFKLLCGVKVVITGQENIQKGRAVVLVSNHQSEWETYILQILITPISTVLKKELLSIPFFGWGLRMVQPIAIDRSKRAGALKQLIKQGKERIDDGRSVLIFPEGTRTKPGMIREFNKGAAMLATSANAPLLPLVHDAGYIWPNKRWRKFPGTIRVVIGPMIESEGKTTLEVHEEMSQWMRQEMDKLTREEDKNRPA